MQEEVDDGFGVALDAGLRRALIAVDDGAAQRGSVAAHELRQRVDDHIRAVLDRPQQDRRRDGVVDDERNPVTVRHARQRLDVADVARGISDRFAEHRAGAVVDQLLDVGRLIACGEPYRHTLTRKYMGEQRMGGPVELRHRHDVAAEFGDVEQGIIQRGLSGAHA